MKLALIGGRLSHSWSAVIHKKFFDITGIKGSYELLEIPEPEMLFNEINNLEKRGYRGFNVTIPYKLRILENVDVRSREVRDLNAANTILLENQKRFAYNTDYFGFQKSLETAGIEPRGNSWLILGSGGGSKSVRAVLDDMGASCIYIASTSKKGTGFVEYDEIDGLDAIYGVVNTTPVGMYPDIDECPLEKNQINKFQVAVDIVYNPAETVLLRLANEKGMKTVNGLYMLVAQAIKSQEIWCKKKFDNEIIDCIYEEMRTLF